MRLLYRRSKISSIISECGRINNIRTVSSIEEIKNNIKIIDSYLASKDNDEVSWAKELIRRGRHFIAVPVEDGFRFYPSRFIGYADNTMSRHDSNDEKDGKETSPVISKVLNLKLQFNDKLEYQYKDYCDSLGLKVTEYKRKYWLLSE